MDNYNVPTDVLKTEVCWSSDDDDETIESVWIPVCVLVAVITAALIALLRRTRALLLSLGREERKVGVNNHTPVENKE